MLLLNNALQQAGSDRKTGLRIFLAKSEEGEQEKKRENSYIEILWQLANSFH